MKKYILLSFIFALFIAWAPPPSLGEFYKYKDENGVTRFTDNLAEVPPAQRPEVDAYSEPSDFITPAQPQPQKSDRRDRGEAFKNRLTEEVEKEKADSPEQRAAQLRDEKKRLEIEYNEIMEQQKVLSAERETLKTPASYRVYNKKQKRLRERAEDYEERRKLFEEEVKAFNSSLSFPQPVQ